MLETVLAVFLAGLAVGQLLRRKGVKPKLSAYSAIVAAVLLFVMGLNIGLAGDALTEILSVSVSISLILGIGSAVASVFVAYLLRGSRTS
jgi:hypothetical protein